MAVYVDALRNYPVEMVKPAALQYGTTWCHLVADNEDELHVFASKLGLKRSWFQERHQFSHYDLTPSMRMKAVRLGAQEIDLRTYVKTKLNL